jgi:hypothetical protein
MRSRGTNIEGVGAAQRPRVSVEPMARVGSSAEPGVEGQRAAPQNEPVEQHSRLAAPGVPAPKVAPPVAPAPSFDDDEWEW